MIHTARLDAAAEFLAQLLLFTSEDEPAVLIHKIIESISALSPLPADDVQSEPGFNCGNGVQKTPAVSVAAADASSTKAEATALISGPSFEARKKRLRAVCQVADFASKLFERIRANGALSKILGIPFERQYISEALRFLHQLATAAVGRDTLVAFRLFELHGNLSQHISSTSAVATTTAPTHPRTNQHDPKHAQT